MVNLTDFSSVRRVKPDEQIPVEVNSVFAIDGAWDRKYVVTKVEPGQTGITINRRQYRPGQFYKPIDVTEHLIVHVEFIGRIFADGRVEPAKRYSRTVLHLYNGRHRDNNYCHVVPRDKLQEILNERVREFLDDRLCQSRNCKNKAEADHPCPYLSDVNDNNETLCNCCGECQAICADDI